MNDSGDLTCYLKTPAVGLSTMRRMNFENGLKACYVNDSLSHLTVLFHFIPASGTLLVKGEVHKMNRLSKF